MCCGENHIGAFKPWHGLQQRNGGRGKRNPMLTAHLHAVGGDDGPQSASMIDLGPNSAANFAGSGGDSAANSKARAPKAVTGL